MEQFFEKEHLDCPNYETGHTPTMEVIKMRKNDLFPAPSRTCAIAILLEGNLAYTPENKEEFTIGIKAGQMVVLPPNRPFQLKAEKNAKTLLIRLKEQVRFCEYYSIERLIHQTDNSAMREDLAQEKVHLLTANKLVENYLSGLVMYIRSGLSCKSFFEVKTKEFFHLLRNFYPKEKLSLFFRDILSTEICFTSFVICNYKKYNSVSHLAAAANMSLWTFEKQFKKAFDMPAYQWLKEHRAKEIYQAICMERTPLKELAIQFGFSSKSSFSVFCRKNLGEPPGELRRKALHSEKEQQNI